jgi:hypothetical protein
LRALRREDWTGALRAGFILQLPKDRLMSKVALTAAAVVFLGFSHIALADSPWPAAAKVYFIEPANGAAIDGKVIVKFGLSGMGVAPAGVEKANTGHHHLLIDIDAPTGEKLSQPLPVDAHVRHFGGGQTETVLDLAPGKHSLQLILGDANHIPHDPPLASEKIEIEVK